MVIATFTSVISSVPERKPTQLPLVVTVSTEHKFTVNYDLPLEQAIAECNFGSKIQKITTENFPNQLHERGQHVMSVTLFHFNGILSWNKVVKEMDVRGFRPATLRELLAYARENPNQQRKHSIIGLGSIFGHLDHRDVPELCTNDRQYYLDLWEWRYALSSDDRFLAVLK